VTGPGTHFCKCGDENAFVAPNGKDCLCQPGFKQRANTCEDIDECEVYKCEDSNPFGTTCTTPTPNMRLCKCGLSAVSWMRFGLGTPCYYRGPSCSHWIGFFNLVDYTEITRITILPFSTSSRSHCAFQTSYAKH